MFMAAGLLVGAVIYVDYTYGDDVNNPMVPGVNAIPYSSMVQVPANTVAGNAGSTAANIGPVSVYNVRVLQ